MTYLGFDRIHEIERAEMTASALSRFLVVTLVGSTVALSCERDAARTSLGDEFHDLGAAARRVRIKVKCKNESDGLQVDWAIRPNTKRISRGGVVTWILHNSDVTSVLVKAKDSADWPFATDEFTVTNAEVTTGPAAPLAKTDYSYGYTITAVCSNGGETATSVLDPDVVIRGAGSVDTLGNDVP